MIKKQLVCEAIGELHPDFVVTYFDFTQEFSYENLKFEKGSFAEIDLNLLEQKIIEVRNVVALRRLRNQRDDLLRQSDWMANSDVTMTEEWRVYRQALRDITTQTPSLDENGQLTGINWPTKPEA